MKLEALSLRRCSQALLDDGSVGWAPAIGSPIVSACWMPAEESPVVLPPSKVAPDTGAEERRHAQNPQDE